MPAQKEIKLIRRKELFSKAGMLSVEIVNRMIEERHEIYGVFLFEASDEDLTRISVSHLDKIEKYKKSLNFDDSHLVNNSVVAALTIHLMLSEKETLSCLFRVKDELGMERKVFENSIYGALLPGFFMLTISCAFLNIEISSIPSHVTSRFIQCILQDSECISEGWLVLLMELWQDAYGNNP